MVCLIGLFVTGLSSCEKEEMVVEQIPKVEDAQLVANVTLVTDGYLTVLNSSHNRWASKWIKKIIRILWADVWGFVWGWHYHHNLGYAIWEGVWQSIQAACIANVTPSHGPWEIHNSYNMYEIAGVLHYELIDSVYAYPTRYFDSNGQLISSSYSELAIRKLNENGLSSKFLNTSAAPRFDTANVEGTIDESNASTLFSKDPISVSRTVQIVLGQYLHSMEVSSDVDRFASYSKEVEQLVATSSLDEQEKMLLQATMATARHGRAYWDNAIPNGTAAGASPTIKSND